MSQRRAIYVLNMTHNEYWDTTPSEIEQLYMGWLWRRDQELTLQDSLAQKVVATAFGGKDASKVYHKSMFDDKLELRPSISTVVESTTTEAEPYKHNDKVLELLKRRTK